MKIKLKLSYDGTDFGGWQKQPSGKPTIQGELEAALSKIMDQPIQVVGAGRTDAGVHARAQVAHAKLPKDPAHYKLLHALNGLTPSTISIQEVWKAPEDFHALHSATQKTYHYRILNRAVPSALRQRFTHWIQRPLDIEGLNRLSAELLGQHDFKSFQTTGTELKTTVRDLSQAHWERRGDDLVVFRVQGSGFLKQMVRNLVGTLLELSARNEGPEKLREILAARDRQAAGTTAAAQGLFLFKVDYPRELDNKCRKI